MYNIFLIIILNIVNVRMFYNYRTKLNCNNVLWQFSHNDEAIVQ